MSPGADLYVAHTPYHVFLACILAHSRAEKRSELVLIEDFAEASRLASALRGWSGPGFRRIDVNRGVAGEGQSLRRRWRIRSNASKVISGSELRPVQRVFLFNDYRPEGQAWFLLARRSNPSVELHLVEDGLAYYVNEFAPERGPLRRLAVRWLAGNGWIPIPRLGTHPWALCVHALFPEHLVEDVTRGRRTARIQATPDLLDQLRLLAETYVGVKKSPVSWINLETVLLLPHSSGVEDWTYLKQAVAHEMRDESRANSVGFKLHPLETERSTWNWLNEFREMRSIEPGIPAEFVFLLAPSIKQIVAPLCTALLSARWMMPKVGIRLLPGIQDERIPIGSALLGDVLANREV